MQQRLADVARVLIQKRRQLRDRDERLQEERAAIFRQKMRLSGVLYRCEATLESIKRRGMA